MKRKIFGGLAILSAAMLPFSGIASAASVVDYEKSIGQVDGADTINWVVEATDDGGYVVGGQTIGCYKAEMMVSSTDDTDSELNMSLAWVPAGAEKVDYEKCVEYYASHSDPEVNGNINDSQSVLEEYCLSSNLKSRGSRGSDFGLRLSADDGEDDEYFYTLSCIDYIAKFKKNGTKEWLTVIADDSRPIAVKKINDGTYRLLTDQSKLYTFNTSGVEGLNTPLDAGHDKAFFNNDGSFIGRDGGYLAYYKANGALGDSAGPDNQNMWFDVLLPAGTDKYVAIGCTDASTPVCKVYDINKDLSSIKARDLKDFDANDFFLISANKQGDVILSVSKEGKNDFYSFDEDGNQLGKITDVGFDQENVWPYKDFAVGLVSGVDDENIGVTTKIIKYNRDLSVRYEYTGGGHEMINDVAELNDKSLVGVGVAFNGSTNIPVTGSANGGYLRLVAQGDESDATNRPDVKNPKTWDAVDTVATIGGVALLGFGIFLRRNLSRR